MGESIDTSGIVYKPVHETESYNEPRINVKNGAIALKAKCKTNARQRHKLKITNTRISGLSRDVVARGSVEFYCR